MSLHACARNISLFCVVFISAYLPVSDLCARDGETMHCESRDYRDAYCGMDTRGGIHLVHQTSHTDCIEGQTWGYDRRGIWVTNGCAGEFQRLASADDQTIDKNQRRPDPQLNQGYPGKRITCKSLAYHYQVCAVRHHQGAELVRQLSVDECIRDKTWGDNRKEIWVDHGCAGEFVVF